MEFKNYCIVLIEDDGSLKEELKYISETSVKCLEENDFSICTISTTFYLNELKELLKEHDSIFFIMDLSDKNSVKYNVPDEEYYSHLFSELIDNEIDYSELTNEEKTETMNKILDKGKDNLSSRDKKVLKEIANRNNDTKKND